MRSNVTGAVVPSLKHLAQFHPQFALAVVEGVPVRPNLRTVQFKLNSFTLGQPIEASFDQQITGYSVFGGFSCTIDPTNAYPGNPLKGLSDVTQAMVSGMTVSILVRSRAENDYNPVPTDTPMQLVADVLDRAVGIWGWNEPDNVKVRLTLTAVPSGNTPPITVWMVFSFLVLGQGGGDYLCMTHRKARARLSELGYLPCPCPPNLRGPGGEAG